MKIDFKKQKYIIPLIILPFTFLLFYAYKSFSKGDDIQEAENKGGLQMDIAAVSNDVKSKNIGGKLDAFKDTYKDGDGYTAISSIEMDNNVVLPNVWTKIKVFLSVFSKIIIFFFTVVVIVRVDMWKTRRWPLCSWRVFHISTC